MSVQFEASRDHTASARTEVFIEFDWRLAKGESGLPDIVARRLPKLPHTGTKLPLLDVHYSVAIRGQHGRNDAQ
jgi:hypothetical protein